MLTVKKMVCQRCNLQLSLMSVDVCGV
jgi:hypothetical protein